MTAAPVALTLFELSHFLSVSSHACSVLPVEPSFAAAAGGDLQPLTESKMSANPGTAEQPASDSVGRDREISIADH